MKPKKLINKKELDKQVAYEAFAYFAAGGRNASDGWKTMSAGAMEQSKIDFFEQRQLGFDE